MVATAPNSTPSTSTTTRLSTSQMPPGMVMGPDGKPCKICTAFRNWQPGTTNYTEPDTHRNKERTRVNNAGKQNSGGQRQKETSRASTGGMAGFMAGLAAGTTLESPKANESTSDPSSSQAPTTDGKTEHAEFTYRGDEVSPNCPADVEVLGRATWTFLHTTAAYYPEKPTPTQRANMLMLLRSLPIVYPCTWCAQDFGKSIDKHAPDVSGRVALSRWLCERHNEVNEKLGKENFDCAKVDERWKDGPADGRCD